MNENPTRLDGFSMIEHTETIARKFGFWGSVM
jgi:hypothetical protein